MEKTCPYCEETFAGKRTDSVYCSPSCRQMAYIGRKPKAELLPQGSDQNVVPGIVGNVDNSDTETKIKGTGESTVSMGEIQKPSIDASEEKYTPYQSRFLDSLIEFTNERHQQSSLETCLIHDDLPSYCVSLHLRCLVECLLIFSELKYLKVDDLLEICNAFTYTVRSKNYALLPDEYPYTDAILVLKEKLKKVCIKVENADQIKFRLTQEDKIELIAMRFEMAKFIPKRQFNELDFENV